VQVTLAEQLPSGEVQEQVSLTKAGYAEGLKARARKRIRAEVRRAALSLRICLLSP
jgi:hypothetical protein